MRLVLAALLVLAIVAVVPEPAQAHVCAIEDAPCLAACLLHEIREGHPCAVYSPFAGVAA